MRRLTIQGTVQLYEICHRSDLNNKSPNGASSPPLTHYRGKPESCEMDASEHETTCDLMIGLSHVSANSGVRQVGAAVDMKLGHRARTRALCGWGGWSGRAPELAAGVDEGPGLGCSHRVGEGGDVVGAMMASAVDEEGGSS